MADNNGTVWRGPGPSPGELRAAAVRAARARLAAQPPPTNAELAAQRAEAAERNARRAQRALEADQEERDVIGRYEAYAAARAAEGRPIGRGFDAEAAQHMLAAPPVFVPGPPTVNINAAPAPGAVPLVIPRSALDVDTITFEPFETGEEVVRLEGDNRYLFKIDGLRGWIRAAGRGAINPLTRTLISQAHVERFILQVDETHGGKRKNKRKTRRNRRSAYKTRRAV